MDVQSVSLTAGIISTNIFAIAHVPMLVRAFRTKDLRSYSAANLLFSNLGNAIHWIYIVNLPFGPIWFLHSFYTVVTAMMLFWYVRYRNRWSPARPLRLEEWRANLSYSAWNGVGRVAAFCPNRKGER